MLERERIDLQGMYDTLYGAKHVDYVPLQYKQFNQIRVFQEIYTSRKSRTTQLLLSGLISLVS